jgi:hypothetical protein
MWRFQIVSKKQARIEAFRNELKKIKEPVYKTLLEKKIEELKFNFIVGYTEKRPEFIEFYVNQDHNLSPKEFKYSRVFLKFENGVFKGLAIKSTFLGLLIYVMVLTFQSYAILEDAIKKQSSFEFFIICTFISFMLCILVNFIYNALIGLRKIKLLMENKLSNNETGSIT